MGYLVGLGYKALAGKDSVGNYLVSKYGWEKRSFADNLKRCCMSVFGLTYDDVYDQQLKSRTLQVTRVYSSHINERIFMWMSSSLGRHVLPSPNVIEGLLGRELFTPRDILQFVGTEVMRAHVPDYHIKTCIDNLNRDSNYVICDVRFPNEAAAILESGGFCVKLVRSETLGKSHNMCHASEMALDGWADWFYIINNNREGLHFLYEEVEKLLQEIKNVR